MAIASISAMKSFLSGGGVRANQFTVELSFPSAILSGNTAFAPLQAQFLCNAAALPESSVDPTPVEYRGRTIFLAGERRFKPWTVRIINDTNFNIRDSFEIWSNYMNNNINNTGAVNPSQYVADLAVTQMDRNNNVIKTYKFVDAWPAEVSDISLDYGDNNTVETFTVTFLYQYWVSNTTNNANGLGLELSTPIGNFPLI
jgi:hypothetical protein